MRMIGFMTLVCLLLLLAMIPAFLQFARACGVQPGALTTTLLALVVVAGMLTRRT